MLITMDYRITTIMSAFIHANAPSAIRIISDDDIIGATRNTLYAEVIWSSPNLAFQNKNLEHANNCRN